MVSVAFTHLFPKSFRLYSLKWIFDAQLILINLHKAHIVFINCLAIYLEGYYITNKGNSTSLETKQRTSIFSYIWTDLSWTFNEFITLRSIYKIKKIWSFWYDCKLFFWDKCSQFIYVDHSQFLCKFHKRTSIYCDERMWFNQFEINQHLCYCAFSKTSIKKST